MRNVFFSDCSLMSVGTLAMLMFGVFASVSIPVAKIGFEYQNIVKLTTNEESRFNTVSFIVTSICVPYFNYEEHRSLVIISVLEKYL